MPCRQADRLRGYRKWGEGGRGVGGGRFDGVQPSSPQTQNPPLKPPFTSLPLQPKPTPSSVGGGGCFSLPLSPPLLQKPLSQLAPTPQPPPRFIRFYNEQDCKHQPGVCERRNSPLLFSPLISPPPFLTCLGGGGEVKQGMGGRIRAFLHSHTSTHPPFFLVLCVMYPTSGAAPQGCYST